MDLEIGGLSMAPPKATYPPCPICGNLLKRKRDLYCSKPCSNRSRKRGLFERFEALVVRGDGCWGWNGCLAANGYAIITDENGKQRPASHVSCEIAGKALPEGKTLWMHSCDTPSCVNPDHLDGGTHADNMRDMATKGRAARNQPVDGAVYAKKLTPDKVREIRSLKESGEKISDIARRYDVTASCIVQIMAGLTWRQVS
jgi:hypothetical protein